MVQEPEFQIFECSNPDCHLRFPNNLSVKSLQKCPLCGHELIARGEPFANTRFSGEQKGTLPNFSVEILLDNLRSTLNVGSIFRTAEGAGVSHIYCCGTTPTPEHPKIAKTSLGAEGFIPWTYHRNALDLTQEKISAGMQICSIEAAPSALSLFNPRWTFEKRSTLLVMGNEVSGVDPEILQQSNQILYIPMAGKKDSLNVAVAFGIAIYALLHR